MKAMLSGFAAMVIVAVGANIALNEIGFSSEERFSSPSTRIDSSQ